MCYGKPKINEQHFCGVLLVYSLGKSPDVYLNVSFWHMFGQGIPQHKRCLKAQLKGRVLYITQTNKEKCFFAGAVLMDFFYRNKFFPCEYTLIELNTNDCWG